MRTLIRDVPDKKDAQVIVKGWLYKKRLLGGLTFVNIRDRSGILQIKIENEDEVEKLRKMQHGTVISVEGKVVEDERAPGGVELHEPTIEVLVPVEDVPPIEIDKPIDHTSENLDTLFEHRVANLRNWNEQAIFKVRAETLHYIRDFLRNEEFVEIQTPKLLAGATEGGAEVFTLDYFDEEATLAQSPQFYKQMMVGVFERVYEIGPTFRAEPSMTTRHLSEISMLDIEMGFIENLEDVLSITENLINHVMESLWDNHAKLLERARAEEVKLAAEFPRFTLDDVHSLYSQDTGKDTTEEPDLIPAEERWICKHALEHYGSEAVFVTDFPANDMKFYHRQSDEDPAVALRADLLFRGVELATIPLREHRYERLVEQLKDAGYDPEHPGYKYYLQAFKYGLPPHGGFGFGIDRFTQQIIGLNNVKEATLFPRDMQRLAP